MRTIKIQSKESHLGYEGERFRGEKDFIICVIVTIITGNVGRAMSKASDCSRTSWGIVSLNLQNKLQSENMPVLQVGKLEAQGS